MDFKSLFIQSFVFPDVLSPSTIPSWSRGKSSPESWGARLGGSEHPWNPLPCVFLSPLFCLACCRGPFQGGVVTLRSHCLWGALFLVAKRSGLGKLWLAEWQGSVFEMGWSEGALPKTEQKGKQRWKSRDCSKQQHLKCCFPNQRSSVAGKNGLDYQWFGC